MTTTSSGCAAPALVCDVPIPITGEPERRKSKEILQRAQESHRHAPGQAEISFEAPQPGSPPTPDYVTREARQANRQGLIDEIAAWSRELPTDALDHLCDAVGMAAGVCRTTRDVISIRRDTAIVDVSDRGDGVVPLISSPQQFSHAESGIHGVVPYLGEHNDEVLREWLGRTEAGELRVAGVLHSAPRSD